MGNVGTIPATGYESSIDQTFSTPTGTTHTLTYSVASQADILVYVNNVPQEPGVGFTLSGTTTLVTDTLVSGDTLYVKYLALARQTVAPAANSITESMMKDAFVDDFTDVTVTASDIILYGDATDSNNTKKDTVQGILDLVTAGASVYVSTFNIDQSTTGTQAVTGVGFTPVGLIGFGGQSATHEWAVGFATEASDYSNLANYNSVIGDFVGDAFWLRIDDTPSSRHMVALTSFDSDGFTVTKTKSGSPTGTSAITFMCIG